MWELTWQHADLQCVDLTTVYYIGAYALLATFTTQVWPDLPASRAAAAWPGPPLLSPKVLALLQLLAAKKTESGLPDMMQQQQQPLQDWWSAIVFVDTKVCRS